jgi:hypothetical protein
MVPAWVLVFWGFAEARALPGVAFVLASIFALFAAFVADRYFMTTPRTRRWIPAAGVALLLVWIVVLPFTGWGVG